MHFYAFEFGFLTISEKLTPQVVRGHLSFAAGNARALGSTLEDPRNVLAANAVTFKDINYAKQKNCSFGGSCGSGDRLFHDYCAGANCG
jgi:hypothetical protein